MKEFVLTQPYASVEEMLNSAEVGIYKEELEQSGVEKYAIVSRIGNRYDLQGNKIEGFADNPFGVAFVTLPFIEEKTEENNMKYFEIEMLIDKEIEKAIEEAKVAHKKQLDELKAQHQVEIANLKAKHIEEMAEIKANVKAELIARLNG